MESELNPEQIAAVQAPDGPLLVLAAAGTGKTRTLVYRVAHLVGRAVEPRRILLLTFTNKAAREMLERARNIVGPEVSGLWSGTFHHLANRILRRHAHLLGFALDFTILDRDDSRGLMRACLKELKLTDRQFPRAEVLLALLGGAVNRRVDPEEAAAACFKDHPVDISDVLRVLALYGEKKRGLNAMDFDDLLVNSYELFRCHPEPLAKYREQFLYIMVDEYQDTSLIQSDMVDLLAAGRRNIMVVGDDFQSIYSWRGANYRNILTFPERYPDARQFKLETNYRSVPEILTLANACIAGNPRQYQKTLRATRPPYSRPTFAVLRDGAHQARYVIAEIQRLRRAGLAWRDMAVLYRAHYHAMELQLELARAQIPFAVMSGVRFFEQAHVKDACSLLRVMHNQRDKLAFVRLLGLLPGVGEKTAAKCWDKLGGNFAVGREEQRRLLATLVPAAARAAWEKIAGLLEEYPGGKEPSAPPRRAGGQKHDPGKVILDFVSRFYDEYLLETYDDHERRLEDLSGLSGFLAEFDSVEEFLNEVALVTNLDADLDRMDRAAADCLRLSTVHQAKGLEWRAVFILWAAEGMFPSARSLNEAGGDEEERRLFYVAVTRAKDDLFFCFPSVRRNTDGGVNFMNPSRFLVEVPPESLKTEQIGFIA
ncbi:MAG: ATP-dependent helicase [Kiritimatiellae bacterium]|nr:ATP-dependent helicase [Kiritimatiellia bacterium]